VLRGATGERGCRRGAAVALKDLTSRAASREVSATIRFVLLNEANQHFTPSCPGSPRHVACDPGCSRHTSRALLRHSAYAADVMAMKAMRMRAVRLVILAGVRQGLLNVGRVRRHWTPC